MNSVKYVILGGGMVAGYAAKQLAEGGLASGELSIISADDFPPYERPPLSKGYLAGKDSDDTIRINPESFYSKHGIELRLRTPVQAVNPSRKRLLLHSGAELGFEKLVIATGANPRKLDVTGSQLDGVLYLRSVDDSRRIRERAASARSAVVVGGGFIGMEAASVLAQKGVRTTMVLREERIWKQFFTPDMSRFFDGYYSARGVEILRRASILELRGENGALRSVVLAGGQTLACDLLVAGIGVQPATEMLNASGIELGDGVLVNEYLETSRPDIYAAGDVANYTDTLFGKRRRVEHWDNAVSQGQHCARILQGERAPFVHVPYFFSDVFDLSYEFWGDPAEAGETVVRGDITTNSFSVWWIRQERLVAAFAMNRPDEEREAAPKWIEARQRISGQRLAEQSRPVQEAL